MAVAKMTKTERCSEGNMGHTRVSFLKRKEESEQTAPARRDGPTAAPHQLQHLAPPPWEHMPPPELLHQLVTLFGFGMPRKRQMVPQSLPQFCVHAPGSPLSFVHRPAHDANTRGPGRATQPWRHGQ